MHVRTAQRVSGLIPELGHAQVAVLAILLTMLVTVLEAAHKSLEFAMQVMVVPVMQRHVLSVVRVLIKVALVITRVQMLQPGNTLQMLVAHK